MEPLRIQNHLQFLGSAMKKLIIILWLLIYLSIIPAWAGSVIIIVHSENPRSTLSIDEVQRIFLGKKTIWKNGDKIVPVYLKKGESHNSFLRDYLGMNNSQLDIFWKHVIFTGKGQMPKTFESETDIVDFIIKNPGGVGYIDSDTQHSMVKTISLE